LAAKKQQREQEKATKDAARKAQLEKERQERAAKEAARKAKVTAEKRPALLYKEGLELYNNKQYKEAYANFKEVQKLKPNYLRTKFYMYACEYIIKGSTTPTENWSVCYT